MKLTVLPLGTRPRFLLAASLALLLQTFIGCATSPTIASNADPQVRFQNYHTFSVARDRAPVNAEITPELIRGVRDATIQAFSRKGLTEGPENQTDLIVLVHGGIQEHVDVRDWGFNYGRFHRWGWGASDRFELTQYREGTLIVDVFDGRTRDLLWRGTAVGEVAGPPNLERVREALNRVVDRFPG